MCEINVKNFKEKYADIKSSLEAAKFIGIDLEFSALNPISNHAPSLFDSPRQRYAKLRKNVEFTIPIQIGLTAFQFNADKNHYKGNTYTFYVKPGLFSHINSHFYFESSSLEFLASYNFDFNKFVYSGIPYISKIQEQDLRKKFLNKEIFETNVNFSMEVESILESQFTVVNEWYKKAKNGDYLTFPELSNKFKYNLEFKYFFNRHFRRAFKNLWSYENNDIITFRKVSDAEFINLNKNNDLDTELVENLLGFTKLYNLLTSLRKPLVAHNAFLDILILINNFEGFLPTSYDDFKKLTTKLFPCIYDTKHMCYNIKNIIPKKQQWDYTDLKSLFEFFKNGTGRHLVMHSPAVDIAAESDTCFNKYHEAGWDSFCAGYIFIRMAFFKIQGDHPKSKIFMPTELLNGVAEYKNCLNVIRGSVNHIKLDNEDPESSRPPCLVVETMRDTKLDLKELTSALSAYGNVEVKPISWRSNKAIVAVENFGSAKSLLRGMNDNNRFRIQQYSFVKHSPVFQLILWGGVTLSGVALVWFIQANVRR